MYWFQIVTFRLRHRSSSCRCWCLKGWCLAYSRRSCVALSWRQFVTMRRLVLFILLSGVRHWYWFTSVDRCIELVLVAGTIWHETRHETTEIDNFTGRLHNAQSRVTIQLCVHLASLCTSCFRSNQITVVENVNTDATNRPLSRRISRRPPLKKKVRLSRRMKCG